MADKEKITLSDRPPVSIDPDRWPVIAIARWHEGVYASQSFRRARITVREHADGRRIVYGWRTSQYQDERERAGGYLLDAPQPLGLPPHDDSEPTVRAIRRVAGVIDMPELADEVIADLPAVELV